MWGNFEEGDLYDSDSQLEQQIFFKPGARNATDVEI